MFLDFSLKVCEGRVILYCHACVHESMITCFQSGDGGAGGGVFVCVCVCVHARPSPI